MAAAVGALLVCAVMAWLWSGGEGHSRVTLLQTDVDHDVGVGLDSATRDAPRTPLWDATPVDADQEGPPEDGPRLEPLARPRATVRVTIVDEAGEPAPSVGVLCSAGSGGGVIGRTDASGVLLCEIDPGIAVFAAEGGGETRRVQLAPGELAEIAFQVVLGQGIELRVEVTRPGGEPIEKARIWLSNGRDSERGQFVARTDSLGLAVVHGVGQGQFVCVLAEGHLPSGRLTVEKPDPEQRLEVVLTPGGAELTGLVADDRGHPLAGADVQVGGEQGWVLGSGGPAESRCEVPPLTGITDGVGRFEFTGLPVGETRVDASFPGLVAGGVPVRLRPGVSEECRVELVRGGDVHGRVSTVDGAPPGMAQVFAGEYGVHGTVHVFTDEDGRYRLDGLAPGEVSVTLQTDSGFSDRRTVTVVVGESVSCDFTTLPPARHAYAGVVREAESGQPLSGWLVLVGESEESRSFGVTDAEGRFEVPHVEPVALVRVFEGQSDVAGPAARIDRWPAARGPLIIEIPIEARATATFSGQVAWLGSDPPAEVVLGFRPVGADASLEVSCRIDARFESPALPAGDYLVEVRALGRVCGRLRTTILPRERRDLGRLDFTSPGDLQLEGVMPEGCSFDLVDETGLPLFEISKLPWHGVVPAGSFTLLPSAASCDPTLPARTVIVRSGEETRAVIAPGS